MIDITVIVTFVKSRVYMVPKVLESLKGASVRFLLIGEELPPIIEPKCEFEFLQIDDDQGLWRRFIESRQFVTTKYVVWLPEDDFVNPEYLDQAVRLMNQYSEVVCVEGIPSCFDLRQDAPLSFGYCGGDSVVRLLTLGLTGNDRIVARAPLFTPGTLCHSVMRSTAYFAVCDLFKTYPKFQNIFCSDRVFALAVYLSGDVRFVKRLGLIRCSEGSLSRDESVFNLKVQAWEDVYSEYIQTLSQQFNSEKNNDVLKRFLIVPTRTRLIREHILFRLFNFLSAKALELVVGLFVSNTVKSLLETVEESKIERIEHFDVQGRIQ